MSETTSSYNFEFASASDKGKVRKANEDYFGSSETKNGYLFLVCDGMGGHVGGKEASRIAVKTISDYLTSQTFTEPKRALNDSMTAGNTAILQAASEKPELKGMGTTCVAVLIQNSDVYYAHVGDSRIYRLSGNNLSQITKDHSFVQHLIDAGVITPEEAEQHPRKNEISNALGLPKMQPPTVCQTPMKVLKDDCFLLCSDGLTGMVPDDEIKKVLTEPQLTLQQKADRLIHLANNAGGTDNITVQIIKFNRSDYKQADLKEYDRGSSDNKKKNNFNPLFLSVIVILGILTAGWYYFHSAKSIENSSVQKSTASGKNDSLMQKDSFFAEPDSIKHQNMMSHENDN